jgi:hypothetical protein
MALFSTACPLWRALSAVATPERGGQLVMLSCDLSCADADPLNINAAAAASTNNFVIAKTSSNPAWTLNA